MLISSIARFVRDVGLAEDLAQDALLAALEAWPRSGIPDRPGAWLMLTAKRRALDRLRRAERLTEKTAELTREFEARAALATADIDAVSEDEIKDDRLRLVFIAAHPALLTEARVALTLRLVGSLSTEEIARAFLLPVATVAQRIVRAKRTLSEAHVPFEVPIGADRVARVASVLDVLYLIFNEGYAATAGADWMRPELCEHALRMGRALAELVPDEPEVHGLVALMEIQASRLRARTSPSGEQILLLDQDRSKWDRLAIARGLTALARATDPTGARGPYTLQAAIAACHARASVAAQTDRHAIVALYDALAQLTHSPVVELNRAVAVGMAFGAEAGLELVDALRDQSALERYHLVASVRAHFFFELERFDEAVSEYERAAALTQNAREQNVLLARAALARGSRT